MRLGAERIGGRRVGVYEPSARPVGAFRRRCQSAPRRGCQGVGTGGLRVEIRSRDRSGSEVGVSGFSNRWRVPWERFSGTGEVPGGAVFEKSAGPVCE